MCTQCGATDERRSWSSVDEATEGGVFTSPWACATCAWTEFEIVEGRASADSGTAPDPDVEHAQVSASGGRGGGTDPIFRSPA
jgi:hypothetical protein